MISSGAISDTIGRLPAMKMTEPYSPTARAKASATPVSHAGSIGRKDHAPECLRARGAEAGRRFFEFLLEIGEHRLHRAHDERQADEGQREDDAERRVGDLDAQRFEILPDPAVRRVERR